MIGSLVFVLHLFGFSLMAAVLIAGFVIEGRLRGERNAAAREAEFSLARALGLLSPVAVLVQIGSGIGAIVCLWGIGGPAWYSRGWFTAKMIFFAIMVVNGLTTGVVTLRKRNKLLGAVSETGGTVDPQLKAYNRQITLFYLVQSSLLLIIVVLSVLGTGKHPGLF